MGFPYPYVIMVSDGKSIRTIKPAQLGSVAVALDAALCDLLLEKPVEEAVAPSKADELLTQAEIARNQGYTGDCCTNCAQFRMKQSGHCLVCDSCGTTTGCS